MKLQKTTKNVFAALALTALMATPALAADTSTTVKLTVEKWAWVTTESTLAELSYDGSGTEITGGFGFTADSNSGATLTLDLLKGEEYKGDADFNMVSLNGALFTAALSGSDEATPHTLAISTGMERLGVAVAGTVDLEITNLSSKLANGTYGAQIDLTIAPN